jgi:DNA-binding PucR family transcriptional regulator
MASLDEELRGPDIRLGQYEFPEVRLSHAGLAGRASGGLWSSWMRQVADCPYRRERRSIIGRRAKKCENPHVDIDRPAVADVMADISAALTPQITELSGEVYDVIVREIPELRADQPVLTLLASSVDGNVATCLQVLRHGIDLANVRAPAAAEEYARRLAQRGTPLATLLRAYRLGHARFLDRCLGELAQRTTDVELVSTTSLRLAKIVAEYIDQMSEDVVRAYETEKQNWLRNRSAVQAARVHSLLAGEHVDVSAAEATLGYRLHQHHVGLVCWVDDAAGTSDELTRLERTTNRVGELAGADGRPLFLPRDESSAWAWLPFGTRGTVASGSAAAWTAGSDPDIHFAIGDPAHGSAGFLRTYQQAIAAQAVALAAQPSSRQVITFHEVAPVALMLGSIELLRTWVAQTLASLATDDEHRARLRDTLRVFLEDGGSYKAAAQRLTLHKNTVQYRIRKGEEGLGRPLGDDRLNIELALLVSHWLGAAVLQPAGAAPPQRS